MNTEDEIIEYFYDHINITRELNTHSTSRIIQQIVGRIVHAYEHNKKVIWFGNGGSAADAQHLSCELVSKFKMNRKALSSIALTTNTSILTAIGNDFGFKHIFARQIEAIVQPGDIIIGITTSGNSENVIEGFIQARKQNALIICLTGELGNNLKRYLDIDILLDVPSDETSHIQEMHITIGHIICQLVEEKIFGSESNE